MRRTGEDVICARDGCEQEFYIYPSDKKRGKRYCSQFCCKQDLRIAHFGSKSNDGQGYIRILLPDHPNARKDGRVSEHTVVMVEMLGRPLLSHEEVHHKNGVRDDNAPGNLELWSTSQPRGQRVSDKIAWAKEIIRTYEPDYEAEEWW